MRFEDLSAADQKLLNTDLGDFEKEAAAELALADEMYTAGFQKLAVETADYLDSLYEEKVAAEKEDSKEDKEEDKEEEKKASDLSAFIERGYFDGLRKLGSERYGDEMAYLMPFVEEKIAEAGAAAALAKLAEGSEPAKKEPGNHYVRRALLGNPISSAIEAEKGKKLKAFGSAAGHGLASTAKGMVGGAGVGAGVGALASLASKGRVKARVGSALGAATGGGLGAIGGAYKGNFGSKGTEIHKRYSKDKN